MRKPSAERRVEIGEASLRIVGGRGVTALTTANLAREVGVTTGALFRHFDTLEDILREAVRQGLRDGTIDAICTDHAPHHYDAKEREFDDAPNGIIGLETALGLAVTELVESGLLTLSDLVLRMSVMPARIFNLPGGTLAPGSPADVVVFDPAARWTVRPEEFFSKSRNTPFGGRELQGRAHLTIVRGQVVFQRAGGQAGGREGGRGQ